MAQTSSKQGSQTSSQMSLEDRIRIRAYEIFLRRGGQGGSPEEDWILAERELGAEGASPGATATASSPVAPVAEGRPAAVDAGPPTRSVKAARAGGTNTASRRSR